MGLSVSNQVDQTKYFSLSTIDKNIMQQHGLTMSVEKLKNMARQRPAFVEIYTGKSKMLGQQHRTKIYRYEDFKKAL